MKKTIIEKIKTMIKSKIIILILLLVSGTLLSQDLKKEAEIVKTKMDVFSSKTGTITKFIDTKLPDLKISYSSETKIRFIVNGTNSAYFYQISRNGEYGESTASIEYNDIIEVLKAIKVLQIEIEKDIISNQDYLENKFVTTDGFQVGYYIDGKKVGWYIKLEKYGSDNTLFINNGKIIETAFTDAKSKIDELKNNNK